MRCKQKNTNFTSFLFWSEIRCFLCCGGHLGLRPTPRRAWLGVWFGVFQVHFSCIVRRCLERKDPPSVPRTVYSRQPLQRRSPGFPSRDCRGNLCFFHQWVGCKCRHCVPPRGEMPNPVLSSSHDCWGTRGAAVGYCWELRRASSIPLRLANPGQMTLCTRLVSLSLDI